MDFSKHSAGTTSVKVHHAPGGRSNFSLAWNDEPAKPTRTQPKTGQQPLKESNTMASNPITGTNPAQKTSVRVRDPPGGRSNIVFG